MPKPPVDEMTQDEVLHQMRLHLYGPDYEEKLARWSRLELSVKDDLFVWHSPTGDLTTAILRGPVAVVARMEVRVGSTATLIDIRQLDDGTHGFEGEFIRTINGMRKTDHLLPAYFIAATNIVIEIDNSIDPYIVWNEMTWRDKRCG